MRDPYLYEDTGVLRNILNINDDKLLKDAEADYVSFRLRELVQNPLVGDYHTEHLLGMHEFIFQDIYDWAGKPRTINIYKEESVLGGMSVEYSDPFDIVADLHHTLKNMRDKEWKAMDLDTLTVEFCSSLARLWKIHPFREGNTRLMITFCCQFIESVGIEIERKLFEENSGYVRTALVAYNAFFVDGNDFSKHEYLERIVKDAFERKMRG